MHIKRLRLRNFRNYLSLDVSFQPGFHLLLGDNGQGKSNLLEAIYLLSTLRSFRGSPNTQMISSGQKGYFVGGIAQSDRENEVRIYWSAKEKKLSLNGHIISKMSEYYGTIRSIVFCAEDIQLVKGAPDARRRYLDFLLAQTDSDYLNLIQRYGRALRARNAILKQNPIDRNILDSFSNELVLAGNEITNRREVLLKKILPFIQNCYEQIAGKDAEKINISYYPSTLGNMSVQLAQSLGKEKSLGYTLVGPHRDDIEFFQNGLSVAKCASEGQKRTWAISLKMAQTEYLLSVHNIMPIILIDDVMGELDAKRRKGFLPLLNRIANNHGQMFMTCTEENWPEELSVNMLRWKINNGQISS